MGSLGLDTDASGGDGRYTAVLHEDWNIWGPNGGYLAAVALRAAGAHVGGRLADSRPASLLCHYVGVASFDAVDLSVTTLRAAKRAESVRVSMTQGGRPVLEALVWAVGGELDGMRHDVAVFPADVGPPEAYKSMEEWGGPTHPFGVNMEQRPRQHFPDWDNRPAAAPEFHCWTRFRPEETFADPWVDAGRLAVLVDTFQWPAAVRGHAARDLVHAAPSLDLACQFHRPAAHEPWLLADTSSPLAEDGLVAATARVWDRAGRLLASGTQQMLCRPVRPEDYPHRPLPPEPDPAAP